MKFTKMEGIGNDYIYINCFEETVANPKELAIKYSDRHFGVGSDGLILICPSEVADVKMSMFNADGSQAEMCGNGVRCVGKYSYDHGLVTEKTMTVETLAGIKTLELEVKDGKAVAITVDMGEPILESALVPAEFSDVPKNEPVIAHPIEVCGETYQVTCVSMGNPHAVVFVDSTKDFPLEKVGPHFENHVAFPKRINTEFIEVLNDGEVNMRVWERGSGETLACGTGACASAVASFLNHKTKNEIILHLLGGDLKVRYDQDNNHVYMTGPARTVYTGELPE